MKVLHRWWCLLLGALLPSACSESIVDPPEYGPAPEYGAPHATVILDGVVVNNLGSPIKDIVVELDGFGSTTSDTLGHWALNKVGFSSCLTDTLVACGLEATDVDDAENGGPYDPELVILDLEKTSPGIGWNLGTWEQHDVRIVLDEPAMEYGPQCARAARKHEKTDDS